MAEPTMAQLFSWDVISSHVGSAGLAAVSILAAILVLILVLLPALAEWPYKLFGEGFYPTPDIWNRLTGAGTPLDFDIIRPEGFQENYNPGSALAHNQCGAKRTNGPIASNACKRHGAPISADRVTRLIANTPSGCDCSCMCPAEPGDVLGVIKQITPDQLNQPLGAASAVDDAEMAAKQAAAAAAEAAGSVAEAEAAGMANSNAKKNAAMAANMANKAMNAANRAKMAANNGKVMEAEKAANEAERAAHSANKAKAAANNALQGGPGVGEMDVLSNVMKGTPFGPGNAKAANDKKNNGKGAMMMNGNKVEPYKKGGPKGVPLY